MDAAAAAYVALSAGGTDTLLMAADHALRRELNRRIRDDLITLGIVTGGPAVTIADGTRASAGDLIICTRNDHTTEAGEPGRTLANGDLLRIEAITRSGLLVRRALDADTATGQRRWTDRHFVFKNHEDAELGYAVTDHAAQGRTVTAGLAVITGTEDRQHAYVALSRGTDVNLAYVFTASPRSPTRPPARARPLELARYDRRATAGGGPAAPAAPADPLVVLAGVLDRDGQQQSATQTRRQALADADHLAILHAIWAAETTPARDHTYRDLLMNTLPPGYRRQPGHQAKWLWRTLRAAELAGLNPAGVLANAIAERDLAGSRDIAAVIDARIRHRLGTPVPLPPRPWSAQVPALADPGREAYLAEIAALMDARNDRIGEHAATHSPPWATAALGPVPAHPPARLEWQKRAAAIGAWRELSGYDDPADPIGPEPATAAPDVRAAWHHALAALGPAGDARRARYAGWQASAPARHLPGRDCLGPPVCRGRTPSGPRRRLGRPAAPACAPPPRPVPPGSTATTTAPQPSASWPPATRPWSGPTCSARPCSPRRWPTAPTGTRRPAPSVTSPSPPTPSCAAATPASTSRRCARPNPSPPPAPSVMTSPSPQTSHPARSACGSTTWPPSTGPLPIGSPTGKARPSRPMTPTTPTSARRSPPGPARAESRSCSRPGPKSRPPRGSSNARQTATSTGKLQIDGSQTSACCQPGGDRDDNHRHPLASGRADGLSPAPATTRPGTAMSTSHPVPG